MDRGAKLFIELTMARARSEVKERTPEPQQGVPLQGHSGAPELFALSCGARHS